MQFWGSPLAILCGWLEDRNEFLQALLQFKQPEFGFDMLNHVIYSLPLEVEEQCDLFKNTLAIVPLSAQVDALQRMHQVGDEKIIQPLAHALFERHLVKELDVKNTSEIWQNSEKSLQTGNNARQLAALAQFAGDNENAEKLLALAIKTLSAEMAGVLIQNSSLHVEKGIPVKGEIDRILSLMPGDGDVQNEIAMISEETPASEPVEMDEQSAAPLAEFLGSEAIFKAGNETLAKEIAAKTIQPLFKEPASESSLPGSERALNWNPRRLLDQLIEFGFWNEARQVLSEMLLNTPTDINLIRQSAAVAQAMADHDNLIEALGNINLLEPENREPVRQLAEVYSEDADWENAFDCYDTLVQQFDTDETEDWLGYAETALKVGKSPVALEFAQKVLDKSPENARALAVLGYAHHKQGNTEKALEFLNRSVALSPDSIDPWLLMADLYKSKNETSKAIEVLQTAKNSFPNSGKIRFELAKELLEQGQAAEALATLKETRGAKSPDLESSLLMIRALKELNLPEAEELIERTHQAFPASPEAAYEYAALQLGKGERVQASELLSSLIQKADAPSLWKLAYVDSILGEDYRNIHSFTLPEKELAQKCKSILTETLLADPENIYSKVLSAELAIKEGQTAKAFEFLSNLLKDSSSENSSLIDRIKAGFTWAATLLGKFDQVLTLAQSIVDARPEWASASQTLAEIQQSTGEITDAVNQANQVLAVAPDVEQSVEWFANFMSSLG